MLCNELCLQTTKLSQFWTCDDISKHEENMNCKNDSATQ